MNSINDLLKRIALGLLGLSLMAYGLWPRNEESTATRTRTRNAASVGSAAKAITPPLVKIPIKDMRVGTRVPAFNPEVSATERAGFREPNWYQWMKLRLEMPKPDGTLLEIEMLRSEEWLIQQMAVVVQPESIMLPAYSGAELNAANASAVSEPSSLGSPAIASAKNAAATEATVTETTVTESRSSESRSSEARSSEARSSESRSSESRSSESRSSEATRSDGFDVPLRPVYFHLASLLDEVAAGGNEVLGLVVQLDLPELGLSGPAWIVDLEPAPITPPGPGQVVTATFKHASANVLDLVLTDTPPRTQTTSHSTQPTSYSAINTSPSVPIASPSDLIASPSTLSSPPIDSIGVTANHPFWSVDRAEFVQAGELTIGERLQTLAGDTVWVQQKLPRPGSEPVYNLEVYDEHVYYVGTGAVLAHNAGKKYRVAKHGDMPSPRPGKESHHGVMSAWMKKHFPGYDPDKAPAVLMSKANHRATFGVYNTWRKKMRKEMDGTFDWSDVSESQMRSLSGKMFSAAKVPADIRREYWRWFARMKGALSD